MLRWGTTIKLGRKQRGNVGAVSAGNWKMEGWVREDGGLCQRRRQGARC